MDSCSQIWFASFFLINWKNIKLFIGIFLNFKYPSYKWLYVHKNSIQKVIKTLALSFSVFLFFSLQPKWYRWIKIVCSHILILILFIIHSVQNRTVKLHWYCRYACCMLKGKLPVWSPDMRQQSTNIAVMKLPTKLNWISAHKHAHTRAQLSCQFEIRTNDQTIRTAALVSK